MVPQTDLTADKITIAAFLAEITSGWNELSEPAALELRCLFPDRSPDIQRFEPTPDGFRALADHAAVMNSHGLNAYVVINPVRPSAPLRRHGKLSGACDEDIIAAFYFWADGDDEEAANSIRNFAGPRWTMAVTTGRVPSPRPHIYWRCDEAVLNLDAWTGIQKAIAARLSTDRTVVNPSRIMRLPGTVNWPTEKKAEKGRVPELATLRTEYDDDRDPVTFDQMLRAFGPGPSLSQQAQSSAGLSIDTGPQAMDREAARIKALSGDQWNIEVFRLVGSYVRRGLADHEIHQLTDPLTLSGYTVEQTRREVQSMIDRTRASSKFADVKPYATLSIDTGPEASFDAPVRVGSLEWFDDIEPSLVDAYLVKGLLSSGAMSVIYGPSNSGKTFFALDLAYHIAIGAPWRGRRVVQASVLYLAAEGGTGVLNRISALKRRHGVCDVPMAVKRAGMDLLHDQADLQHIAELSAQVKARNPQAPLLIVIDTLSRIMAGGDENSAADMTALIRNVDGIRELTGAHIVLVHHTGKDTAKGARGHSSLRAATDTEIEVANDNGARAAMVTKQRDYQGGETFAFNLESISLGFDQDGDEVTSCVVVETDETEFKEQRAIQKVTGAQKLVLEAIDQMIGEGACRTNPGGVGMPDTGSVTCVDREDLRRIVMGKMPSGTDRSAFNKALTALRDQKGLIHTGENLVWRVPRIKEQ